MNHKFSLFIFFAALSGLCPLMAAPSISNLSPSPGDVDTNIETLTFDLGESLMSGNLFDHMEFTGPAIGSEFAIMGISTSGTQVTVSINEKMLSGNLNLIFHAQNLVGTSGNALSGDNVFSYTIGQPTFDRIEIEREDGLFIVEGKLNFGTSEEFLVPLLEMRFSMNTISFSSF